MPSQRSRCTSLPASNLRLCRLYLGDVVGVYSDWTPIIGRGWLFDEPLDRDDPWQYKNFRVD